MIVVFRKNKPISFCRSVVCYSTYHWPFEQRQLHWFCRVRALLRHLHPYLRESTNQAILPKEHDSWPTFESSCAPIHRDPVNQTCPTNKHQSINFVFFSRKKTKTNKILLFRKCCFQQFNTIHTWSKISKQRRVFSLTVPWQKRTRALNTFKV